LFDERLTRLNIRGFRSIRDVEIELGDLTVLIGANGAGKTNLIQFFLMLSYMMSSQLQLFIGRKGGGSSILHYGPRATRAVDVALEFRSAMGRGDYECSLSFAAPDTLLFTDEKVQFQRSGYQNPFVKEFGVGHLESQLVGAASGPSDTALRRVARVFQRRLTNLRVYHFHDTSDEARIRTRQDLHRDRYLMTEGGNLASFLYMLQEQRPDHFRRILSTIRLVVPYFERFVLDPGPLVEARQIFLRWSDRSGEEFGVHQLSDGSLRAIALITALLQPDEFLPSLVVIDEPELGLHPTAIGLISDLMRAASLKTQVVVATQSPRLLTELLPEHVVVVERHEDSAHRGYSTFQRLSADALGDWLKDYDLGALYEMNVTGGGPE
jgi:predicted ATPase